MKRNTHHDFQYSKLEKALIDPKSALPTGLDSSHTGYSVTIAGNLYVWNGTVWNTWNTDRDWRTNITIAIDSEKTDSSEFLLETLIDEDDRHNDIYLSFETTGTKGCLGMISQIGVDALTSWEGQNNKRVIVTANTEYGYFNIQNLNDTDYDDYKPIKTGRGQDIYNVIKAEFIYNEIRDLWILLSYEKLNWSQRHSIADSGIMATSEFDYIYNLPFQGRYKIDAFVTVSEYTSNMGGTLHDTNQSQSLNVIANNTTGNIDLSGITTTTPVTDFHWYNKSLQGSAPFEVTATKQVRLNANLPNGQGKQVHAGYVFIQYLGSIDNYSN